LTPPAAQPVIRLLTETEVSNLYGISLSALRQSRIKNWTRPDREKPDAPQWVKIGGSIRYRSTDVEAWIAALPSHQSPNPSDRS